MIGLVTRRCCHQLRSLLLSSCKRWNGTNPFCRLWILSVQTTLPVDHPFMFSSFFFSFLLSFNHITHLTSLARSEIRYPFLFLIELILSMNACTGDNLRYALFDIGKPLDIVEEERGRRLILETIYILLILSLHNIIINKRKFEHYQIANYCKVK